MHTVLLKAPLPPVKPVIWAVIVAGGGIVAFQEHFGVSLLFPANSPKRSQGDRSQAQTPIPQPGFGSLATPAKPAALIPPIQPQANNGVGGAGPLSGTANLRENAFAARSPAKRQIAARSPFVLQIRTSSPDSQEYAFERVFPVGASPWNNSDGADGSIPTPDRASTSTDVTPPQTTLAEQKTEFATPQIADGQMQVEQGEVASAAGAFVGAPGPTQAHAATGPGSSIAAAESELAPVAAEQSAGPDVASSNMPQALADESGLPTAIETGNPHVPLAVLADTAPSTMSATNLASTNNIPGTLAEYRAPRARQLGSAHSTPDPVAPAQGLAASKVPTPPGAEISGNHGLVGNGVDFVARARISGIEVGLLPLQLTKEGEVTARLRDIVDWIKPLIDWSEYERLRNSRNSDKFVSLDTLRAAGINAHYDPIRQEISLAAE